MTFPTGYVERQNLTIRMNIRRFVRLMNAFPKKVENHAYAVSVHYMHCKFLFVSVRFGGREVSCGHISPAGRMQAGKSHSWLEAGSPGETSLPTPNSEEAIFQTLYWM
jgi:hypothetical protein